MNAINDAMRASVSEGHVEVHVWRRDHRLAFPRLFNRNGRGVGPDEIAGFVMLRLCDTGNVLCVCCAGDMGARKLEFLSKCVLTRRKK